VKYMLLIFSDPERAGDWSQEEIRELGRAHAAFGRKFTESGELVSSNGLAGPGSSKTVRVRDRTTAVTDGPFVEAKEHLAGYYVIDCESLQRALEIAAEVPDAAFHAVEVRPVLGLSGMEM
jgi:hypothetical protein